MPDQTLQPTANESPASGVGGGAVTSPSNTGHASTHTEQCGVGTTTKSCRWSSFQTEAGLPASLVLKIDWSEGGTVGGGGSSTSFTLEYSTNGGSSWTQIFSHTNVNANNSGTASVSLPLNQVISQVQVRDILQATSASVACPFIDVIISNIKLELDFRKNLSVLGMM